MFSKFDGDLNNVKNYVLINPLTAEWVLRALIDFTLSNARRFYLSMGNPLHGKGLTTSKTMSPLNIYLSHPIVGATKPPLKIKTQRRQFKELRRWKCKFEINIRYRHGHFHVADFESLDISVSSVIEVSSPPCVICFLWHNKNITQGGDEHCEAMHFKQFDLTFRMMRHIFSKVSVFLWKTI